jgi:hypothetical protein
MASGFSANQPGDRLRFIFDDAVFAVRLPSHATFGDIAWLMDSLAAFHNGAPIAIDLTRDRRANSSLPAHGA